MVHIIAAVCGLRATFPLPVLMGLPKTVSKVRFAHSATTGIEKIAKIGSLTLLVTGLASRASFRGSGYASEGVQTDWKTAGTFYECYECICYYSHYFNDIETLLRINRK